MKQGKIIVIAAPSGCGKSTIIRSLLDSGDLDLVFAVSATTRPPRPGETEGVSYYFMSTDDFREAIADGAFIEYEEVYPGRFYGTPRSEIERVTSEGRNIVLDIDVNGAKGVKELYGPRALTVFIEPPSIDELRRRLESRGTESPAVIDERIDRATYELAQAPAFDARIVNDDLETAVRQTHALIDGFTSLN
ncbi:MAG: guanylate kinase [Muribaculaceae bacterium]|nr:guanylate kinase [Muribaculaceae bacterium]